MSHDIISDIQFDLQRGERQLWSGQPRQGVWFRASDLFVVPFSVLWCGFAIFWEASVLQSGAPGFFALWGIPFILIGLNMVVGRFYWDARRRSQTRYGITSDRVIILAAGWRPSTQSLDLQSLPTLTLTEHANGTGTISFGASATTAMMPQPMGLPFGPRFPVFEAIPNARAVYEIIRTAQRDGRAAR